MNSTILLSSLKRNLIPKNFPYFLTFLLSYFLTLFIAGISYGALGPSNEIVIFADTSEISPFKESLVKTLRQEYTLIREEHTFEVKVISPKDFNLFLRWKNIMVVGTISNVHLKDIYQQTLGKDKINLIKEKGSGYFTVNNIWDNGQVVFVISATDENKLKDAVELHKFDALNIFNESLYNNLATFIYHKGYDKDLSGKLEKYGFIIKIPYGYTLIKDDGKNRFIWFRKRIGSSGPDLILFAYWENTNKANYDNKYWLAKRDTLTIRYYEGDVVVNDYERGSVPEFARMILFGDECLRISGLWENNRYHIGGPFRSYIFYKPKSKRMYMIDICIFGPDVESKEKYFQELETVFRTFREM